ncbi:MAG: PA2169 family four-helix-bundle protein [Gemmatimonadota bacterium]|nr:PA2169 family four-helix-bundle protein [Gemmatimonadota bacterium]
MATDNEVISVLNDLIETCKDGANGFRAAADAVKGSEAKTVLSSRVHLCERASTELQAEVRRLGGDPDRSGSVAASLHRGWIDIKSLATGREDSAIITECERGEDFAVKSYEEALRKDLPANVRAVVERQYQGTLHNRDKVRALKTVSTSTRSFDRTPDREAPPPS